jgi:tetratricopeptide (TPR) repeat protein
VFRAARRASLLTVHSTDKNQAMGFDRLKTLQAAEKNLELGKIPAAITEYGTVVEHDPDDFTTLNMLGDLYVRVENRPAAISCFRRIAEHYREQDFVLKAIAMYKKIDRLQPRDPEIALNLADLYAQQQLVVDARAHYLIVAESYKNSGATQEGLEVLRKIANLDPQNTDIRIKLGEGYLKQGMNDEAATAFVEAGQHLLARASFENALNTFTRALEIYPADQSALKGLLAAHVGRGTAQEAARLFEQAVAGNPDDLPLLSMRAKAYVAAADPDQAERSTAALVGKQPSDYLSYVDVARLYLNQNQPPDAVRLIEKIAEQMLAEREDNSLLSLLNEVMAADADNIQALRILVRVHWWQRDTDSLKAVLDRLADAAKAAGQVEDERYALTQLTRLTPECEQYAVRLEEIGGAIESVATEELPQREEDSETTRAGQFIFAQADATPVGESEFEWNSVATPADDAAETEQNWTAPSLTFDEVVAEELSITPDNPFGETQNDPDGERKAQLRRQELESVDFYIAQGYIDIAHDTLNLLEQQFGAHADINSRRQKLNGGPTAIMPASVALDNSSGEVASTKFETLNGSDADRTNPASSPAIDSGLAEIFEEYRISAEAESDVTSNGDYETHYNLGLAYKEMDLFEEALEEFQIAVKMVAAGDGTDRYLQCCNLLGHCFMQKSVPQAAITWFNKGLSAPDASDDERQALRYELGMAYEQMGDLRNAIHFFTEVYGIDVQYRGVRERLQDLQARLDQENGSVPHLTSRQPTEQLVN